VSDSENVTRINLATTRADLADLVGRTALVPTADGGVVRGVLEAHPRETGQMRVRLDDGRWAATGPTLHVVTDEADA